MNAKDVIRQAKQWIEKGETDRARELLLEYGFERTSDATIQAVYEDLVPPSQAFKVEVSNRLKELGSDKPPARRKAIALVDREASKEPAQVRAVWMKEPRLTAILIRALSDTDTKTVVHALHALARIARLYFRDRRALLPALDLLSDKREAVSIRAIATVAGLAPSECFAPFIAMFEGSSAAFQAEIFGLGRQAMIKNKRPAPSEFTELAKTNLSSSHSLVRESAANFLRDAGVKAVLPALRKALSKEEDPGARESLELAITELGGD